MLKREGVDELEYIEFVIDQDDMEKYLYHELVRRGFIPTERELNEISNIMFEYIAGLDITEG